MEKKDQIQKAAWDIQCWIQDAVSDMAFDLIKYPGEDVQKLIRKAKRDGVSDIAGWYGDYLYNDKDTLHDLTGDRIHDAAQGKNDKEKWSNMILIAEAMKTDGHPALSEALNEHIKSWKEFIEKLNNSK